MYSALLLQGRGSRNVSHIISLWPPPAVGLLVLRLQDPWRGSFPAEVPAAEKSLAASDLLDQIADGPGAPEPERKGGLLNGVSLGDVSIGAAAAGAAALGAAAARQARPGPVASVPVADLQALQEKLAALATQVMGGSVAVATCDFFKEALPGADVVAMGMILHDWGLPKKKLLMKKVAGHVALAV